MKIVTVRIHDDNPTLQQQRVWLVCRVAAARGLSGPEFRKALTESRRPSYMNCLWQNLLI